MAIMIGAQSWLFCARFMAIHLVEAAIHFVEAIAS